MITYHDQLPPPPVKTIPTHTPIKDFVRGVKRVASDFPKLKDEKNRMIGIVEPKYKPDPNLWMKSVM